MPPGAPSGLTWTPLILRFDGSLETKQDARLSSPPDFDVLRDAQFEEVGALQTRPPFDAVMGDGAIFGGGTLANCRKLAAVNGELCLFTDTGFYSWNAQLSAWVLRGTHLAVSVDEAPRFATTGDQIDGDRAELAGTVVYAWTEGAQVYAAALDKATGSVLVTPTKLTTPNSRSRPRLVALATKILLFTADNTNDLIVQSIDPADPATGIASAPTGVLAANFNLFYDVARAGTQDLVVGACRRQTTTSYTVFSVTPALSVATATPARTCDGPIAVSTIPDGTKLQVVRANGTNIQGDLITTSGLVDSITGQAIGTAAGTPVNQIAACHRSVQNGGAFRCYAFWDAQESSATCTWVSKSNWVDSAGSLGSEANFVRHHGVASRAFDFAGQVYVWMAFGGQTTFAGGSAPAFSSVAAQNTYFLWRDDQFLSNAKAVATHGGGLAPSTGRLPGVALTAANTYAWCATARRRIDLGGTRHVGFAAREPIDVTFAFDSNASRRSVQLGASLYITGGEVLQYDGVRLVETGFHIYPWLFGLTDETGGGTLAPGTYAWKETWRYQNAQGETERSTTATAAMLTVTGNQASVSPHAPLVATHKTAVPPAVEIWRTAAGPLAVFFLVTSNDPTVLSGANRYIPNDPTSASLPTLTDGSPDADVTGNEANPENETVLESLAPPAARIIVPTETRLLLAGIAGDPDAWWYSRERGDGEVASFHDELRVEVPPVGGAITAMWADDQFVYIARATAIYAYAGPGKTNDDSGQNYALVRTISRDVGVVSQEAHAPTPVGRLLKSSKGWQLLGPGGDLRYVGGDVAGFDTDTIVAVHTITARHQVRILTTSRLLVWDYRGLVATSNPDRGRWGEWTLAGGLDAVLWNGDYVYLTAAGPRRESASFAGVDYGLDAALAWIKPADLFGAVAVRKIQPLGEYRGPHLLRLRVAYNYDETIVDDVVWNPSPAVIGGPLQVAHGPKRRLCEAIKVRLTAVSDQTRATLATATLSPAVSTDSTPWAATWRAERVATNQTAYGELGDRLTMSIAFGTFGGATIADLPVDLPFDFVSDTGLVIVNDHHSWDPAASRWVVDSDNIGVLIAGTLTVAELEAAIAEGTTLATLAAADVAPSKAVNVAGLLAGGLVPAGQFSGGAFGAPSSEALALTGLGLEVGIAAPGLYNRLPGSQRV